MTSPLAPGDPQQLGEYWLSGRLGSGGQGVVYEAYDESGDRVAVKVLHPDVVRDPALRGRVAREVETARRVAPFCTARVIAAELTGERPYIVSEFVDGPSLRDAVERDGPFDPGALFRLAVGVATALTNIHQAGVVHRDLKPGNVLLGPDGPRVIDFGLARTEEMSLSASGELKGTPRYMSPEVMSGERAVYAADVWAWGAVVLYAAHGRDVFDGNTIAQVMHRVVSGTPDVSVLGGPLLPLVTAALNKNPAARPQARAVLLALLGSADATRRQQAGDGEPSQLLADGSAAAGAVGAERASRSLAEAAESVYASLPPDVRDSVPRVLLRMVNPGAGADDALRPVDGAELRAHEDTTQSQVLDAYSRAGLLSVGEDTVELANAALLRAWPRLRSWVEAERDGLATHHRLADSALFWDRHGRKPGDVYQGTSLERAMEWAATGRQYVSLNRLEREYLQAGTTLVRVRTRRRRVALATLAAMVAILLVAVGVITVQRRTVTRQRDDAIARQVAAEADRIRRIDPRTARQLSVAAYRIAPVPEARAALYSSLNQREQDVFTPPVTRPDEVDTRLSDDGRHVYTSDESGVQVWNVDARKRLGAITVHASSVGMSPDGRTVAITKGDGTLQLWDVVSARPIGDELPVGGTFKGGFLALGFSPDGRILMTSRLKPSEKEEKKRVQLWDWRQRKPLLGGKHILVESPVISGDGRFLVGTKGMKKPLRRAPVLYDLKRGKEVGASWLPKKAWPMAISADSRYVAIGADDLKSFQIFDRTSGKAVQLVQEKVLGKTRVHDLQFSPDGNFLDTGDRLWRLKRLPGDTAIVGIESLTKHDRGESGIVRFSPGNRTLRLQSRSNNTEPTAVSTVDVSAVTHPPVPPSRRSADTFTLNWNSLSENGRFLTTTGYQVWDVRTHKPVPGQFQHENNPTNEQMSMSSDGRFLAIGNFGSATVWDVKSQRKHASVKFPVTANSSGRLAGIAVSEDGTKLAAEIEIQAPARVIQLWDLAKQRLLRQVPTKSIGSQMAFSPDGRVLATGDGAYAVASGKRLDSGDFTTSALSFSRDGKRLATASNGNQSVIIWETRTMRRVGAPLRGHTDTPVEIAFSPDGRTLATAARPGIYTDVDRRDQTVRLWDLDTGRGLGKPIADIAGSSFDGNANAASDLAFSDDGSALYVWSFDARLREFPIAPRKAISTVCTKTRGGLTKSEWKRHVPDVDFRSTCP